jgi:hypothetical protein
MGCISKPISKESGVGETARPKASIRATAARLSGVPISPRRA